MLVWILDVVAGALTCEAMDHRKECHRWYFPSRFSRTILSSDSQSIDVYVDLFARKYPFMGDACNVRQIFVPVNDRNFHWFLVVMDVPTKKTYIVDSLPSVDQTLREDMATKIVGVIEAMCKHIAATNAMIYDPSWPHSRPIEHLPVRRQPNLYDCGLYVIAYQRDWDLLLENPATFGLDRNYRRHVLSCSVHITIQVNGEISLYGKYQKNGHFLANAPCSSHL
ncbi:hypothetical protein J5N97_018069 [Dioscorea zingiberensis]|uniref:Ubiquitin-like protease family profile domain-containing protein n=1 Tax=Dioscorea zingiberensis TaxID=325984 RepID=A0A9D5CNL9_9LILI|nr:hypothetical protein J5N97_018069 [Dioscorea zingiberensis]